MVVVVVVVMKCHWNEFDVAFDFVSMLIYLNDDRTYSYFWVATSVVDQPFVVKVEVVVAVGAAKLKPTSGHWLPSMWMNA